MVSRGPGELSPILPDWVACFAMLGGGEERDQAIGRGIVYPALYCGSLCSLVLCPDLLEPYGYFLHLKYSAGRGKRQTVVGGGVRLVEVYKIICGKTIKRCCCNV